MIAIHRLIPFQIKFLSKLNKRTLVSGTIGDIEWTLKREHKVIQVIPSQDNIETITFENLTPQTETENYRLLDNHKGVRALLIKSKENEEEKTSCCVRVDAGSIDNKHIKKEGMAHLLEHIKPKSISGVTYENHTLFSFEKCESFWHHFWDISNFLFSTTSLYDQFDDYNERVGIERARVNSEFNEKRGQSNMITKLFHIFIKSEIQDFPRNPNGNDISLTGDDETLAAELDEFRSRFYLTRPVFVCIKSSVYPLDIMEEDFLFHLCGDTMNLSKTRSLPTDTRKYEKSTNSEESLFIVRSDADRLNLKILFPFECFPKQLDPAEINSLGFFAYLMSQKGDGSLTNYLYQNGLGTYSTGTYIKRTVIATTNLTRVTKDDIDKVVNAFYAYIEFIKKLMPHELQRMKGNYRKYLHYLFDKKSRLEQVKYLAKYFEKDNKQFNLADMFSLATHEQEQNLLKNMLGKKNVIYVIETGNPEMVKHSLDLHNVEEETEEIYKTKYNQFDYDFSYENEEKPPYNFKLLKEISEGDNSVKHKQNQERKIVCDAWHKIVKIVDPTSEALQRIYINNAIFESRDVLQKSETFLRHFCKYFVRTTGGFFGSTQNKLHWSIYTHFHELTKPEINDEIKFKILKEYTMRKLTSEIIDSSRFAKSFLDSVVKNVYCEKNYEPIFYQYKKLQGTEWAEYKEYQRKQSLELKNFKDDSEYEFPIDEFDHHLLIDSINLNEFTTVTLQFRELDYNKKKMNEKLKDLVYLHKYDLYKVFGIYTVECNVIDYESTFSGLLIKVTSVEEKHDNRKILNAINKMMTISVLEEMDKRIKETVIDYTELKEYYETTVMKRIITIQILGHSDSPHEKKPFNEEFRPWLEKPWIKEYDSWLTKTKADTKRKPFDPPE